MTDSSTTLTDIAGSKEVQKIFMNLIAGQIARDSISKVKNRVKPDILNSRPYVVAANYIANYLTDNGMIKTLTTAKHESNGIVKSEYTSNLCRELNFSTNRNLFRQLVNAQRPGVQPTNAMKGTSSKKHSSRAGNRSGYPIQGPAGEGRIQALPKGVRLRDFEDSRGYAKYIHRDSLSHHHKGDKLLPPKLSDGGSRKVVEKAHRHRERKHETSKEDAYAEYCAKHHRYPKDDVRDDHRLRCRCHPKYSGYSDSCRRERHSERHLRHNGLHRYNRYDYSSSLSSRSSRRRYSDYRRAKMHDVHRDVDYRENRDQKAKEELERRLLREKRVDGVDTPNKMTFKERVHRLMLRSNLVLEQNAGLDVDIPENTLYSVYARPPMNAHDDSPKAALSKLDDAEEDEEEEEEDVEDGTSKKFLSKTTNKSAKAEEEEEEDAGEEEEEAGGEE